MCTKAAQYDVLKAALEGRANIKLILVPNKGHNPNYTEDAVKYLGEYVSAKTKLTKKKKLETEEQKSAFVASYDWNRMTLQDEAVWNDIFECLDS